TSFEPCCFHTPPERAYTHAAPKTSSSVGPPTMAIFPSWESETDQPWSAGPMAPVPTRFACWVQRVPERVYTHAAPKLRSSATPPTIALFPSLESETE